MKQQVDADTFVGAQRPGIEGLLQWSTIRMVNTLTAMHNIKGKQIDFIQAFPQAKLKEDIYYLRFPAGFEHKNEEWAFTQKINLYGLVQA
jgi:hypothetical protein